MACFHRCGWMRIIVFRFRASSSRAYLSRLRPRKTLNQFHHCQGIEGTVREELLLKLLAA